MKPAVLVLLFCSLCPGQVLIKLTPEPMAVPLSQLPNAKTFGRWQLDGCNQGPAQINLLWQQVSIASPVAFIDPADAALVLNSQAQKTFWAYLKQYGALAAQGVAIGLAVTNGHANSSWVAGLGIGATILPQIVSIAGNQAPTAVALLNQLQWPLVLPPGGCFTDHRFAAKMKAPQAVVITIKP